MGKLKRAYLGKLSHFSVLTFLICFAIILLFPLFVSIIFINEDILKKEEILTVEAKQKAVELKSLIKVKETPLQLFSEIKNITSLKPYFSNSLFSNINDYINDDSTSDSIGQGSYFFAGVNNEFIYLILGLPKELNIKHPSSWGEDHIGGGYSYLRFAYSNVNGEIYRLLTVFSGAGLEKEEVEDNYIAKPIVFFTDKEWTTSRVKLSNKKEPKSPGYIIYNQEKNLNILFVRIPKISDFRTSEPDFNSHVGASLITYDDKKGKNLKSTFREDDNELLPVLWVDNENKTIENKLEDNLLNNGKYLTMLSYGDNKRVPDTSETNTLPSTYSEYIDEGIIYILTRLLNRPKYISGDLAYIYTDKGNNQKKISYHISLHSFLKEWLTKNRNTLFKYGLLALLPLFLLYFSYYRSIRRLVKLSNRISLTSKNSSFSLKSKEIGVNDEIGLLATEFQKLLHLLEQKQSQLEIEVEQKSQVNAQIGHEILSPLQTLSSIIGDDKNGQRKINRIVTAVKQIQEARDVEFAFDNNKIEPQEISGFLKEYCHYLSQDVENLEYINSFKKKILVKADLESLEQVFDHLINNAEYHRNDDTRIIIQTHIKKECVYINVDNKGKSIPSNDIDRIFQYGFSTKQNAANLGQGLFVCKKKVIGMEGTIKAENVKDGVRFTIGLLRV